jgi:superoxide reductase
MIMAERLQVYKCEICGNIVEVLHGGAGTLVCCGEDMVLQVEGSVDAAVEKHVPVVEKTDAGIKVLIGSVPHPMETEHYIEWAQLIAGDISYRIFLKPGVAPEALFEIPSDQITAREYCNIHGLWKSS